MDFEAIETAARRQALKVAARAVEQRLNGDDSDHAGARLPCPSCHDLARYAGRRNKTFTSVLGDMKLSRAYYHCDTCEEGFCPRDAALPPEEPPAPTLYLGMDGTGVPMRASELKGREGKQPDGSSKTREVKLATVWSAEGRDEQGTPVRDEGSVTYSAAIESAASKDTDNEPSAFAARAMREATRRGFERAPRRAVLGDGAAWIWNLATEYFPDAIQIVDRYHANEHLREAGKAIYGPKSDLAKEWTHNRW